MTPEQNKSKYDELNIRVDPVGRFRYLDGLRQDHLRIARECSALTNPAVCPPLGFTDGMELKHPHQSHGSRLVANMASQLLLVLFPPGMPFFRLDLSNIEVKNLAKQMKLNPEVSSETMHDAMRKTFVTIENECVVQFDQRGYRERVRMLLEQLIVTGACCFVETPDAKMNLVGLADWVCVRDSNGELMEVIYRQRQPDGNIHYVRAYHFGDDENWTVERWSDKGELLSLAVWKPEDMPIHCINYNLVLGEDYGRGQCEENLGDLRQFESGSLIITQTSSALAKMVVLVRPNSVTKIRDVASAANCDIIAGDQNDVGVVQPQKQMDLSGFINYVQQLKMNLDQSFMMASVLRRDAERVTAEEIRRMANELEKTRGGVYSGLSMTLQAPLARMLLRVVLKAGAWNLTLSDLSTIITTGLLGLGRSMELENTLMFLQELQLVPNGQTLIKPRPMAQRLAALRSLELDSVLMSDEELLAQQQAATVEQTIGAVAPEYIKGALRNG